MISICPPPPIFHVSKINFQRQGLCTKIVKNPSKKIADKPTGVGWSTLVVWLKWHERWDKPMLNLTNFIIVRTVSINRIEQLAKWGTSAMDPKESSHNLYIYIYLFYLCICDFLKGIPTQFCGIGVFVGVLLTEQKGGAPPLRQVSIGTENTNIVYYFYIYCKSEILVFSTCLFNTNLKEYNSH